jgi:hypothetical protein
VPDRDHDSEIEREIREGRKFTPQEAMGRMAGPGAMKGASPVARSQQAENEIGTWLRGNIGDSGGALQAVLHRHLKGSRLLLDNVEQPLVAIADYCRRILASDERIETLVQEADVEWGRAMDERPYFQRDGSPPHPEDPYTVESVRSALSDVVARLEQR